MANEFCTECGAPLSGGTRFCTGCGAEATPTEAAAPAQTQTAVQIPSPPLMQPSSAPGQWTPPAGSPYEPITTGGYIGISFLMMIPLLNLLLIIIWACGGCRKVNKRNYARGTLVLLLIGAVIGGALALIFNLWFKDAGTEFFDLLNLPAS